MAKYTPEMIAELKQSPFIENVTENSITYGPVFEHEFYRLSQAGYKPEDIFRVLGVNPEFVGYDAVKAYAKRMKSYEPDGSLTDDSDSVFQTMLNLKREVERLRFENKFLKKKRLIDMGLSPKQRKNGSTSS